MSKWVCWIIAIIALCTALAHGQSVEIIATDGAPYRVMVNGEPVSDHTTWHKAAQSAINQAMSDPAATVRIRRDAEWRVNVESDGSDTTDPAPDEGSGVQAGEATPIPADAQVIAVEPTDELLVRESGTADAPIVYRGAGDSRVTVGSILIDRPVEHVWFLNLNVTGGFATRDPNQDINTGLAHAVIEDCRFSNGDDHAVLLQSRREPALVRDITFRRNVVEGAARSGVFAYRVHGLTIEHSQFIRNGSDSTLDHGLYAKECNGLTVYRSFFARNAAQGVKLSSDEPYGFDGAVVENCLFYDQDMGVTLSHSTADPEFAHTNVEITGNTFYLHKHAIAVRSADGVTITGNVISTKHELDNQSAIRLADNAAGDHKPQRNLVVRDNAIHDWPMRWGRQRIFYRGDDPSVVIENNPYTDEPPADLPDFEAMLE